MQRNSDSSFIDPTLLDLNVDTLSARRTACESSDPDDVTIATGQAEYDESECCHENPWIAACNESCVFHRLGMFGTLVSRY